jgi:CO/xanthine dehydrogenase Mo-binding subunit
MAVQTANGSTKTNFKYIGKPRRLVEGRDKVTGYAQYTPDVELPRMTHIRPVLAVMANAQIKHIDRAAAEAIPGVIAVLTHDDLPTRDKPAHSRNSALLAKDRTLWVGQPVAVVVAENAQAAADGVAQVLIDYEPGPVVSHIMDAIQPDAPQVWPEGYPTADGDLSSLHGNTEGGGDREGSDLNNLVSKNHWERGDVEAGFAEAATIAENRYRIESVHQGYMEPHAVVVDPDPRGGGLTIYTCTQGMFPIRDQVAELLDLPESAVLMKPMTFGGGFGAKYGIYEGLAAAVALVIKRPAYLYLSRTEDFLSTTPTPEIIIDLKTGARADGSISALNAQIYVNNGVFSFNHGGIVAGLIGGMYRCDNVSIDGFEVATFTNGIGAYRAPGAPQAMFALEGNINEMAAALDIDPLEFRYQNAIQDGDLNGTGSPWATTVGLRAVLDQVREHPLWKNRTPGEGLGLAIGGWPNFKGSADVTCRIDVDGRVQLETGIVDISGAKSSLVLIAAEALGVEPESIAIEQTDTTGAFGPGSGGSAVTYTMAAAVDEAAQDAHRQLLELAADEFEADADDLEIVDGQVGVKGVPGKRIGIGKIAERGRNLGGVMPVLGRGQASPEQAAPGFSACLLKIDIDQETGEVIPQKYVAFQDVGLAINPLMVEGQMHGGALQSLSIGLFEGFSHSPDGQLQTATFMDYCLPRADRAPEVEAVIIEHPNPLGHRGIRGAAEPAMVPGPAALAGAIRDATGAAVKETPVRPESLLQLIHQKNNP